MTRRGRAAVRTAAPLAAGRSSRHHKEPTPPRKVSRQMAGERPFGVGIIGLGWVAGEHIKAYQQNPHCRVVALASHSPERAEAIRKQYGLDGARLYSDYQS